MAVDIIVPIYNAYDDLKKCIESVLRYTSLAENRLILINDCSSDMRIAPYIDSLKQKNIIVHHNERNVGFSGNVNYGFAQSSENDVLLLNTDTIVTGDWLKKISRCAAADSQIGTVTPLSNSATICSIPEFCKDNPLPKGYTVDSFGALVEKYSLHRYPEISVGVGFCMYIKREVIEKVGDFDAETFQRGYGEENDFCNRALILGYRHVLCDDTFIYHSGTASFIPSEKKKLIEAHDAILKQRYPSLMERNTLFYTTNPIADISQNIRLRMALDNGKKNVLFLVQRDFREDAEGHIGGTQFHVKDMKNGLCKKYNIFVMARDRAFMRLTIYIDEQNFSFKFRIDNAPAVPVFSIEEHRKLYRMILNAFHIDLVHIHHVYQLSMDLFGLAHEMGIPLVATLHDFYYICPTIKLLDEKNHCCYCEHSTIHCHECLRTNPEIQLFANTNVNYIDNWRTNTRKYLSYCDRLIVPSMNTKKIYTSFFPELENRITPIYHGIDMIEELTVERISEHQKFVDGKMICKLEKQMGKEDTTIAGWAFIKRIPVEQCKMYVCCSDNSGEYLFPLMMHDRQDVAQIYGNQYLDSGFEIKIPLRFCYEKAAISIIAKYNEKWYRSGTLTFTKALHKLPKAKLTVAFVGGISPAKGSRIALEMIKKSTPEVNYVCIGATGDRDLKFLYKKNYYYSHWYSREDLPEMLKSLNVDLVCILPIWPETFCYVLSEVLACGVPIVATDIGALGERVRKLNCGWLVPVEDAANASLAVIQNIIHDRREYNQIRERISHIKERTVRDMTNDYCEIYQSLFREVSYEAASMKKILNSEVTADGFVGEDQELMNRLMTAETELQFIKDSRSYKIVQSLKKINIPFKRPLRAIVFKIAQLLGLI